MPHFGQHFWLELWMLRRQSRFMSANMC